MTLDEMDRLVAEKIMGWDLAQKTTYGTDGPIILAFEGRGDPTLFWKPTRDIKQAWEVLESVAEGKQHQVSYDFLYGVNERTGYNVSIDRIWYESFSPTAPLAICIAALKAKGIS